MWIKLISPRVTLRSPDSAFKRHMAPPLGLLVLGALTPRSHRVTIEDENVERVRLDDSPDLVGITVKADTAYRAYEISRRYRERGIHVILGGIHPTACPEENLTHADAIVIGEAEEIWRDILQDAQNGSLKSIYKNSAVTDLARSPIPRWELIQGKNYLYTSTLCAGRGCPRQCEFCYNSSPNIARGHRMKPFSHILAEIESTGSKQIMFIDDNFIGNPDKARYFLKHCMQSGFIWHTAVSADIGKYDDILDLMQSTGCKSLFIGFETLNINSLASCMKRQNRVEEYESTIRKIHDRGMMVNASLVFGFDHDDSSVFPATLQWLVKNKIETMTAHILTPYPGTKFYEKLKKENRIFDFNLEHYNTSHVVFYPNKMNPDELRNGYLWMYSEFYSLRHILRRLPAHLKEQIPYLCFNLFYRKFGKIVSLVGKLGLMPIIIKAANMLAYPRQAQTRNVIAWTARKAVSGIVGNGVSGKRGWGDWGTRGSKW